MNNVKGDKNEVSKKSYFALAYTLTFVFIFTGIILVGIQSDSGGVVRAVISELDTSKVSAIVIDIYSTRYERNLVGSPLVITNGRYISEVLGCLSTMHSGGLPKASRTSWDCTLTCYFSANYHTHLKHPDRGIRVVVSYFNEKCYVDLTGVMGRQSFEAYDLGPLLEKITKYSGPRAPDVPSKPRLIL